MDKQKGNKTLAIKGPVTLSPEVIKDICDNRTIKNAQVVLANKHGISTKRVANVWTTYFGGRTLADAKDGLKKPLPTKPIPQADITLRKLKTERAQFQVKEPKTMTAAAKMDAGARAKAVKKVAAVEKDLGLTKESVAEMNDEDAERIIGEIEAGNNSEIMMEVLNNLILLNKKISNQMKKLGRDTYVKNIKKNGASRYNANNIESNSESETDDDPSNSCAVSESETDDDADNVYEDAPRRDDERYFEGGGQLYPANYDGRHSDIRGQSVARGVGQFNRGCEVAGQGPAGVRAGTQPVFTDGRTARAPARPIQDNHLQTSRYESAIPSAQYNKSQDGIQPNYSRYDDKLSTPAGSGNAIHSAGGQRPCQSVAGIPWLKPRPV